MHITASVFINDDEPACTRTTRNGWKSWPRSTHPQTLPTQPDGRGQRRRPHEAADHGPRGRRRDHQGKLDFGPWEQIFYGEFDGRRAKRVLIKVIGE